ncbi:hypothetical protein ACFFX1_54710 [Dactylosporangium sucinum]|uniref:Uncharacterized protein n=1 Tax=Dactylosporangium sucinum TaxID=1424081 RepID=A0A917X1V5_9ACTN|nr:hypothetical protein [Dactylosporangium sucinum]GGM53721.1 hypothetical protein GCM10007977_064160 [Dactylosporangium sucinum]
MTTYPPVPPRSPFQVGARVQLHGYAGCPRGPRRDGWRGTVVGGFGTSALWVATDGGFDAVEDWPALTVEGEREKTAVRCTCCPAGAA